MKIALLAPVAAAMVAVTSGCLHNPADPTALVSRHQHLREQWRAMLSPYGLVPAFPLFELTQPGDVFVACLEPTDKEVFPAERVTYLDEVGPAVQKFYGTRVGYADSKFAADGSLGAPTATAALFTPGSHMTQLGAASYPEIFSLVGRSAELGLEIPTSATVWQFGSRSSSLSHYGLSIPMAEYVGVPVLEFQEVLEKGVDVGMKREGLQKQLKRYRDAYPACTKVELLAVRETYSTRAMTLSLGRSAQAAFAAKVALQLASDSERKQAYDELAKVLAAEANTDAPGPTKAATTAPPTTATEKRQAVLLAALRQVLEDSRALGRVGFAGGQVAAGHASEDGVALDYRFQKPMVFGMSVVPLNVEGNVVTAGPPQRPGGVNPLDLRTTLAAPMEPKTK